MNNFIPYIKMIEKWFLSKNWNLNVSWLKNQLQKESFVIFFLLLIAISAFSQKQGSELIDSLKLDLVNLSDDTNKVNKLCRLAFEYHRFDPEQGIDYAEKALRLANSLSWKKGLAYAYNGLGVNNLIKGDYPKALDYFMKSLSAYSELGNNERVATLSNNIGIFYTEQENLPTAIEYFNKSMAINKKIKNDKGLSLNYGNLANIYNQQKLFAQADAFYHKALRIDEAHNNKDAISRDLSNIAANKIATKEYCESLDYGLRSLKISAEIGSIYNQGNSSQSIGNAYLGLAVDSNYYSSTCKYYLSTKKENLLSAVRYLKKSIAFFEKLNNLKFLSEASLSLSKTYEALGDQRNALLYYKKHVESRDSTYSHDNSLKIARVESKFEIEIREKQLIIKTLELENRNKLFLFQLILFVIVILTVLIITFTYYKKQKFQKAINLELNAKNLALHKSEERLRILFETMPIGFYNATLDGHVIDANPALVKMLGYDSKEELLGISIPSDIYFNPFKRDEILRNNEGSINFTAEFQVKTKDGRIIWVEENARKIFDENDSFLYFEGFFHNITERRKSEEILRESEEKFRVLFETMPIGFYRTTLDGYCVDVNPAFVKMLGYDSKEELQKVYIPRDVYVNDLERDEIIKKNKYLEDSTEQYQLKTKDGKIIWVEDNSTFIKDEMGRVIFNEGFCHDITDRKQAEKILRENEEKYRFMFAHNPQPMFIYDPETLSFLEVNQSMESIYGYTRKEFLNMTLEAFHLPEDNEKLMFDVDLAKQISNPKGEWRHVKKNGEIIYVEIRSHTLTYLGKNARHVLIHDVTERNRAEDALRQSEEKFRNLITNIKDVVYSVDAETKNFKYLSPSFERITGYSNEDILEMGGREAFLAKVVTKEKLDEWDKNLAKIDSNQRDIEFEHNTWWLCKDGSFRCLEDHWTPIFENGRLVSTDGILIDITDRMFAEAAQLESERKYKDLFENMPNGYYRSTHDGYYVDANPAFIKMLGYEDKEELLKVYIPTDIYVEPDERDIVIDPVNNPNNFEVYRQKTKDGRIIWLEDNARYIKNDKNEIIFHEGICRDITDRKLAEEAMRKSEEKFRLLFETMPNGYYRSTHDGYYVDANPAFIKMLGYESKEDLLKIYIPTDMYVEPSERDIVIDFVIDPENNYEVYRLKTKDGRIIWLEDNARYIKNGKGEIIFHEGICRDITEQKQAQEAMRISEEKFRLLFETMPNGFYRSTKEGRYVDVNPAFVKIMGYESKEELLKVYIPTDVYVAPEEREQFIRQNSEYEDELVTFRQKTKDGRIIWLEENARYIKDENGEVIFYEGICRDITDKKLTEERIRDSEEKLSTLFSSMTEMVALHEVVFNDKQEVVNYRITDCNDSFSQVTGIKKEDAIRKLATEVYQTKTPPYLEEFARVAQTGEPFNYTTYFEPMDKHFMVSVVSPKKNQFATITTDITAIQQIQELVTAKSKELENYLYIASHDLRSPMVNIQGFSQRLQKQSNTIREMLSECQFESELKAQIDKIIRDSFPKTLNFIFSNVAKMDTLINGLLQISRTGRIKMNIQEIDINHLFKTIIAENNFQLSEISAIVNLEELPDCYGDENQLNQLFSNIIGNAIKYRDKTRQLSIEITGHLQYNKVIYTIKDTGIGIPTKYLEKIWDVFFRVDTYSAEPGEGIGLSLAKRIIDKHKGKIWVESEEGKGSTFHIELQKNEFSEYNN